MNFLRIGIDVGGTNTDAVEGSLSTAQEIGRSIRKTEGQPLGMRIESLNQMLATTDYLKAEKIYEGKICSLRRKEVGGFSVGAFTVENGQSCEKVEIGFQNENLVVRLQQTKEILAIVPDLITIVDRNNFQPIASEELRYGQEVIILKMKAPAKMRTEEALEFVGPQLFDAAIKSIFQLLDEFQ